MTASQTIATAQTLFVLGTLVTVAVFASLVAYAFRRIKA